MTLQPQCNQEESASTELDNLLDNLRVEVMYSSDLLQNLFYTANKLKTIQEEVPPNFPPIINNGKGIEVKQLPLSFLEQLDYQITLQKRNNQKLNQLVNHLTQVI